MISYDFQAGTYIKQFYEYKDDVDARTQKVVDYIKHLDCDICTIFEAGIGEATTFVPVLNLLNSHFEWAGGCDISWSRIKAAQKFVENELTVDMVPELFMGDMFNLPIKTESIDLVYTMHAMEPNGGREKELLRELYRITRKYLMLIEPSYELATEEGKVRMDKYGYIKNLPEQCMEMGLRVIKREPFGLDSNPLNPAEVIVIKKEVADKERSVNSPMCCPLTKADMTRYKEFWFCKDSMLSYPIINGVSCLTTDNSVVTTKMIDYI